MKVSYAWLNTFFESPLPSIEEVEDKLTFHAFEVDGIEGDVLDVKVLPNRGSDALSHRGIAKELSALFSIPLARDPLHVDIPSWPVTDLLSIEVEDHTKSARQMGALVRGVTVGPSPAWLRERLESIGQRSINNIVDLTNYVTLDMGQPLHAFDADKISQNNGLLDILVRGATEGETLTTLSGETYSLSQGTLVIADKTSGRALDIAGIKGGIASSIDETTKNIYISVANFDGPTIRKTAQALKLWTDASLRFQNRPSPELPACGMHAILSHLAEIAGGELIGVVDVYPKKQEKISVPITAEFVSKKIGASYSENDVEEVLKRLGMSYTRQGTSFLVDAPFERNDIRISEDLVDEISRVIGFDRVTPVQLPPEAVPINEERNKVETIRDYLAQRGFNEISTYAMCDQGDVELAHPLADDKKYLRTDLAYGHAKAIALTKQNLPLFNTGEVKLFEIGAIWPKGEERNVLAVSFLSGEKKSDMVQREMFESISNGLSDLLGVKVEGIRKENTLEFDLRALLSGNTSVAWNYSESSLGQYISFSVFPFALRDVAVWTPHGTSAVDVEKIIRFSTGNVLNRIDLFDTFEKDGRVSFGFRLVLQASDRTLTDVELADTMDRVYSALKKKEGFEIR